MPDSLYAYVSAEEVGTKYLKRCFNRPLIFEDFDRAVCHKVVSRLSIEASGFEVFRFRRYELKKIMTPKEFKVVFDYEGEFVGGDGGGCDLVVKT